ncbi:MAG: hypothetical protein GX561_03685 [Lentisphaerae bacterium]|jgi:hypothetical protein|nr:hypothetical protein [Lentisphaerota bacterium]
MRNTVKVHCFTLAEVMIATVVLGLAVAATSAIVSGAQSSLIKAENRWGRQHLTTNAAEFYLLAGPNATMPQGVLPDGFSATCQLLVVDDIHEEALEPIDEWILGEFQIQVFDKNGNRISDTRVRKVLKEDDFE